MIRSRVYLALAVYAVVASGCFSSYHEYPPAWAPLRPPGDQRCAEVLGVYLNLGSTYPSPMNPADAPRLAQLLLEKRLVHAEDAVRVVLASPGPGALRITGYDSRGPVYERTLSTAAGEYACWPEGMEVGRSSVDAGLAGILLVTRTTFLLTRTEGGDLAVKHREAAGGVCCLVPTGYTQTKWYLFPGGEAQP